MLYLKFITDPIDRFLNKTTMYSLVLQFLIVLLAIAFVLCIFGMLPFSPAALVFSVCFITLVCLLVNMIFAWAFRVPTNSESVYITALILALIISPITKVGNPAYFIFVIWVSVIAMASKYILAIGRKHVFNPAAVAVVITAFAGIGSASWWVGTLVMMPFVLIGGVLIVRKIQRSDLIVSFFIVACGAILISKIGSSADLGQTLVRTLTSSSLLFFGFIMLTEPLTTPPTRKLRIIYGVIVGILFTPAIHIFSVYSTPELALVVGNIFVYIVSPKQKLMLTLKEKVLIAHDTYDFIFTPEKKMMFTPGQYLEWTLSTARVDIRGTRRYFTIASSPTEKELIMGVKFYPMPSAFKETLHGLNPGDSIIASQLAGDFVLTKNNQEKIVLIAGGIGITPFRSMIKDLIDRREKRPITLIYSNRTVEDIAYKDILAAAQEKLNIKTIYTLTDTALVSQDWKGEVGYITETMIKKHIPDFTSRMYYISGPQSMVSATDATLKRLGIKNKRIKKDFFPGFA